MKIISTFAIPYPHIPGVPATAGAAPGNMTIPPCFRWEVARLAEMEAGHTEDRHMASLFLIKSLEAGDPPAQPPATQITASSLSSPRTVLTLLATLLSCPCQESPSTTMFSSADVLAVMSMLATHQPLSLNLLTISDPSAPRPP